MISILINSLIYYFINLNMCIPRGEERDFSQIILDQLETDGKLTADHVEFLLNKNIKTVRLQGLDSCVRQRTLINKFQCMGSSLTELQCNCDYELNVLKQLLPHCYNVTKICMIGYCTDEALKEIAISCPHLTELNISNSSAITNEGLKSLCIETNDTVLPQCPLKVINLSDISGLNDGIIFILKYVPTLEMIVGITWHYILSYGLLFYSYGNINNKISYNLTNMDFMNCQGKFLSNCLNFCSIFCPHLKQLALGISDVNDLETCALFPELEHLTLDNFSDEQSFININNFLVLKKAKLKFLSLRKFQISISVLIQQCTNLLTLVLDEVQFQQPDKAVMSFTQFHKLRLRNFALKENYCIQSIVLLLNSSPRLEDLILEYIVFCGSAVTSNNPLMSRMFLESVLSTNLTFLSFHEVDMSTFLIQQIIINSNSLRTLCLHRCKGFHEKDEADLLLKTITNHSKIIDFYHAP